MKLSEKQLKMLAAAGVAEYRETKDGELHVRFHQHAPSLVEVEPAEPGQEPAEAAAVAGARGRRDDESTPDQDRVELGLPERPRRPENWSPS